MTDPDENDGPLEEPAVLQAWLAAMDGRGCASCGAALCGHERLRSRAIAGVHPPRCLSCLSKGLGRVPVELARSINAYIRRRACYASAWAGIADSGCSHDMDDGGEHPADPVAREADWSTASQSWDAGELGCGDLVLPLKTRMKAMAPGQRLRLRALDPAAPVDLPAWCRLTGHLLVAAAPPDYLIQRRSGD